MRLLLALLRFCAVALALGSGLVALLGALGFLVPALDILNHLQIPIFFGTLIGLVLVIALVGRGAWRRTVLAIVGAGFLASACVVVPEIIWGLMPRPPLPTDGRPVLKVLSHNVFGLNYEMDRMRDYIFSVDPDIIALQEYFPEQRGPLHPMLIARYPHFALCTGGKRANIALYSKLPFTQSDTADCNEDVSERPRTSRIVATFMLDDGTTFTVLTTHLDWPFPVERQEQQRADLTAEINAIKGPLLVVGDMNSTPWSYAMRGLIADTGLERQTRNLVTYPLSFTSPWFGDEETGLVRLFPFLPLDQVMTRGGIAVHELHTGPDTNSDHLPVVFTMSVEPMTECCAVAN